MIDQGNSICMWGECRNKTEVSKRKPERTYDHVDLTGLTAAELFAVERNGLLKRCVRCDGTAQGRLCMKGGSPKHTRDQLLAKVRAPPGGRAATPSTMPPEAAGLRGCPSPLAAAGPAARGGGQATTPAAAALPREGRAGSSRSSAATTRSSPPGALELKEEVVRMRSKIKQLESEVADLTAQKQQWLQTEAGQLRTRVGVLTSEVQFLKRATVPGFGRCDRKASDDPAMWIQNGRGKGRHRTRQAYERSRFFGDLVTRAAGSVSGAVWEMANYMQSRRHGDPNEKQMLLHAHGSVRAFAQSALNQAVKQEEKGEHQQARSLLTCLRLVLSAKKVDGLHRKLMTQIDPKTGKLSPRAIESPIGKILVMRSLFSRHIHCKIRARIVANELNGHDTSYLAAVSAGAWGAAVAAVDLPAAAAAAVRAAASAAEGGAAARAGASAAEGGAAARAGAAAAAEGSEASSAADDAPVVAHECARVALAGLLEAYLGSVVFGGAAGAAGSLVWVKDGGTAPAPFHFPIAVGIDGAPRTKHTEMTEFLVQAVNMMAAINLPDHTRLLELHAAGELDKNVDDALVQLDIQQMNILLLCCRTVHGGSAILGPMPLGYREPRWGEQEGHCGLKFKFDFPDTAAALEVQQAALAQAQAAEEKARAAQEAAEAGGEVQQAAVARAVRACAEAGAKVAKAQKVLGLFGGRTGRCEVWCTFDFLLKADLKYVMHALGAAGTAAEHCGASYAACKSTAGADLAQSGGQLDAITAKMRVQCWEQTQREAKAPEIVTAEVTGGGTAEQIARTRSDVAAWRVKFDAHMNKFNKGKKGGEAGAGVKRVAKSQNHGQLRPLLLESACSGCRCTLHADCNEMMKVVRKILTEVQLRDARLDPELNAEKTIGPREEVFLRAMERSGRRREAASLRELKSEEPYKKAAASGMRLDGTAAQELMYSAHALVASLSDGYDQDAYEGLVQTQLATRVLLVRALSDLYSRHSLTRREVRVLRKLGLWSHSNFTLSGVSAGANELAMTMEVQLFMLEMFDTFAYEGGHGDDDERTRARTARSRPPG